MGYSEAKLENLVSKRLDNFQGLNHFVARTTRQKEGIFKLRYDAYHGEGLIQGSGEASLSDWQDDESSSSIYGVTLHGSLVSTIRLSVISREHKNCVTYALFKDYLDPLLDCGERLIDGSRLAVRCNDSALRRRVVMYTLSLAAGLSSSVKADHGTMIARHNHAPFYERFGFKVVSGPFSYPEALTPLSLMMIDLPKRVAGCTPPGHVTDGDGQHLALRSA
ncbi:N-acyl amino acid synthase FeeM domain-containing protein [Rhodovulum marinum]|uniref:N-acyl amino acid synthase FeeM catalytic core domain-containing protein n=1 Tax=Rhodovulum marinum TaxID=320662 RepID=A0A4R2PU32_9RHOB|nr:hypothetical protein [Rhodovulum marinum]TCP39543.1 hypothetical protein EV662_11123 [Rhodovulum marinum]